MPESEKVEIIKKDIAAGRSKEEIYKEYLAKGWSVQDVEAGFESKKEESTK